MPYLSSIMQVLHFVFLVFEFNGLSMTNWPPVDFMETWNFAVCHALLVVY